MRTCCQNWTLIRLANMDASTTSNTTYKVRSIDCDVQSVSMSSCKLEDLFVSSASKVHQPALCNVQGNVGIQLNPHIGVTCFLALSVKRYLLQKVSASKMTFSVIALHHLSLSKLIKKSLFERSPSLPPPPACNSNR